MSEIVSILLVDDQPRNLDTLQAILDSPGYRLLRAEGAEVALRHLLENDVAAIVLDMMMPGMSGVELAQLIKGTKKFREIPIVFLTAHMVDDRDVLAGYGAGAVDFLTKPVNPQVLRHKIAVYAELFRKTRALAHLNDTLEARVRDRTAELGRSEAALRQLNRQKDAFLATLAHELRNPLAPIRTGIDLLLSMPQTSPEAARVIGAMNRQVSHMVRLIDDLLDVSRITRGMLELRREPADLASIVEQAVETVHPFLAQRRQTLAVSLGERCTAEVDPTRLAQVIGNLLHNAAKYSPSGSEIRLELESVEDDAVIRVIDAGVGIPKDQLERVFDMFSRIERSVPNANGGLGIGLALARRLAELHGGALTVESGGEGCGATFTLKIPGARRSDAPQAVSGPRDAAPVGPTLDIVVVEDDPDVGETLVMWLENLGHRVQLATTGTDGLALVHEARPDIVLCDIGLPGMDGVEVCRRIRSLEGAAGPVLVALTGWGMESDRQRTAEAGIDHHLVKPVVLDRLRDLLGTVRPRSPQAKAV